MNQIDEPQSLWVDAARHPLGLRVRVWGEETYENTVAYWRAILRHLRLTGAGNLLVVDELEGAGLSEPEWLELVIEIAALGLGPVRIAHVKPHGRRAVEYCELFARDAGYDARVFTSEQDAERWLRDV
ncbi:hypothetical protein [Lysobacter solisilvae (ex Woo and Kim 2020)]|uniref:STAS/SEC14 domain-containing protein n=1 Tax=Agrilutibacter terrestris TaxID=2865112 RepID=A0A7H0FY55_9GAMM|nr:hypothetical protein [Lysobacter terrestris]QNP40971.1 hypothetical protein H8B22_01590 [Lysobacter terrestris]